jgi:hypothetical protein
LAPRGQHKLSSKRRKLLRQSLADTARSAGDEDAFALDIACHAGSNQEKLLISPNISKLPRLIGMPTTRSFRANQPKGTVITVNKPQILAPLAA